MLGACEFVGSAVVPSVGSGAVGTVEPIAIVPLDAAQLGEPSPTPVGARITQFRAGLAQLQQAAVQQVQRGRQLQADMDAGIAGYQIAAGTIRPSQQAVAVSDEAAGGWRNAQAQLQVISATLDQMSGLSNEVAKNAAYAAFLLQSIRETKAAPEAAAEDQRQLRVLEETTSQTSTSIDQLLDGLRQEVLRQSHFLGTEGARLAQIAPPSAVAPTNVSMAPQVTGGRTFRRPGGRGPRKRAAVRRHPLRQSRRRIRAAALRGGQRRAGPIAGRCVRPRRGRAGWHNVGGNRLECRGRARQHAEGDAVPAGNGPAGRPRQPQPGDRSQHPDQRSPPLRPLINP